LGAARGPLAFSALLLLWWLCYVLRQIHRPGVVILALLGGSVIACFVSYSLAQTNLDVTLILDRLSELQAQGLSGHNRAEAWALAVQFWKTSPIWGIGLNNWAVYDTFGYESAHSMFYGLLTDMGVIGLIVFAAFFTAVLAFSRQSLLAPLKLQDEAFYRGFRAGWVMMLLNLTTNLPFTSGQQRNNIMAYAVYYFPLLVMVAYARHAPQQTPWPAASRAPGPPAIPGRNPIGPLTQPASGVSLR